MIILFIALCQDNSYPSRLLVESPDSSFCSACGRVTCVLWRPRKAQHRCGWIVGVQGGECINSARFQGFLVSFRNTQEPSRAPIRAGLSLNQPRGLQKSRRSKYGLPGL